MQRPKMFLIHQLLTVGYGELHSLPVSEKSIGSHYVAKCNMTAFGEFHLTACTLTQSELQTTMEKNFQRTRTYRSDKQKNTEQTEILLM